MDESVITATGKSHEAKPNAVVGAIFSQNCTLIDVITN